jgi:hypothetical protein
MSSEARMLKLNALMLNMDAIGELREKVDHALTELDLALDDNVYELRTELEEIVEEVAEERANGLAEVARERAKGLAEDAKVRAALARDLAAMQKQQEEQQSRIVLDIGGFRYTTSVQTLRRIPGTFFDAYFSGRYTMDRREDGSVFIDRDGEHFGQVLEYMRDGIESLAERETSALDVGMLQRLKQEFDFYCIDVVEEHDVAYVIGGFSKPKTTLASGERFDDVSGEWRGVAPMSSERFDFGLCELADELYAIGGNNRYGLSLATVERYDPALDAWSAVPPMPEPRSGHCACGIGDVLYVLGGENKGQGYTNSMNGVLKFDGLAQMWSELAPMPDVYGRVFGGACMFAGNIYVFGGHNNTGVVATTYRFDTEANEWATLAPMPEASQTTLQCLRA